MKEIIIKENEKRILPVLWTGEETELAYKIVLAGRGSSIKFLGLLLGKKTEGLKFNVTVVHKGEDTKSEIIIKGALCDASYVFFDGLIAIEPGAKGTNAWLAAHLLLLSQKTKGIAVPNLEIKENDVKAGHATTVGRVNDLEMFYLMSRGLPEEKAKGLIVEGFLQSILKEFPKEMSNRATQKFLSPNF